MNPSAEVESPVMAGVMTSPSTSRPGCGAGYLLGSLVDRLVQPFGSWPTNRGDAVNFTVWIVVTLGLGVLAYLLCYFVLAGLVLHERVVAGAMHAEALGFIDWAVL
jgi:hypothetical protein